MSNEIQILIRANEDNIDKCKSESIREQNQLLQEKEAIQKELQRLKNGRDSEVLVNI